MIRPQKYNKRIVAHPDGDNPYDLAVCGAARKILIETMGELEPCNISTLAKRLMINRDRVSAAIKLLGIEREFMLAKEHGGAGMLARVVH